MKKRIKVASLLLVIAMLLTAMTLALSASDDDGKVILDTSAEWRYLDNNTDPSEGTSSRQSWTLPTFDDSKWKTGSGAFGSKNGTLGAVSGCGTPTQLLELYKTSGGETIPTYFFRTTFTVDDPSSIKALVFDMCGDDAIIVYLNGKVIGDSRSSVPEMASSTNMYYASYTSAVQSFLFNEDNIADIIVKGKNTIAVEVQNANTTSSDIYFAFNSITSFASTPPANFDNVVLGVGKDETERIVTWYSTGSSNGKVYCATADKLVNGEFTSEPYNVESVHKNVVNKMGYYSHNATITGLLPDTDYFYVLEVDGVRSDPYYFSTDPDGNYEFVFVGDPQISEQSHGESWIDTLTKIKGELGANLLVSGGDQVSSPNSEAFYSWLLADVLAGLSFAPSIGPFHDDPSVAFPEHFTLPNMSDTYGVTTTGANYWYKYNNTLFIHINTADSGAMMNGEHIEYISNVIEENSDAAWKILVMHTSLFTTGKHAYPNETLMKQYRDVLAPELSKLDIDLVLGGHDHVYVRTYLLDGLEISDDVVVDNTVVAPSGLLYVAASSSTGSKFYEKTTTDYFVAYDSYENRKSAIKFTVTDNSITMNSYFLDDMSIFDTFTIYHSPHEHTPDRVDAVEPECMKTGVRESWVCNECGKIFSDSTCTTETTEEGLKLPALGHDYADATCTEPKTCTREGCGATRGEAEGHDFALATCTTPAICKVCSVTEGEAAGHSYDNACDTDCSVCSEVRTVPAHVDSDGDYVCDECEVELEKDSSGALIAVIAISSAVAVGAAVAVAVVIKKSVANNKKYFFKTSLHFINYMI